MVQSDSCYEDDHVTGLKLGCFNRWPQNLRLPSHPEDIGTKFHYCEPNSAHSKVDCNQIRLPKDLEENRVLMRRQRNRTDLDGVAAKMAAVGGKIIFLIHGWRSSPFREHYRTAMKRLLLHNEVEKSDETKVAAIILVDWTSGAAATNYLNLPSYSVPARNTEIVGRQLANLIVTLLAHIQAGNGQRLVRNELGRVHLVGHSLGAHVAGHAGKWLKYRYNLTPNRITGLDAAWPMFEGQNPSVRLDSTDAQLVDGIHTTYGIWIPFGQEGMRQPYGHLDIYFNNGVSMHPHCYAKRMAAADNSIIINTLNADTRAWVPSIIKIGRAHV